MEKWSNLGFNFEEQAIGYTSQARDHTYKLLAEAINRALTNMQTERNTGTLARRKSASNVLSSRRKGGGDTESSLDLPSFHKERRASAALKKIKSGEQMVQDVM